MIIVHFEVYVQENRGWMLHARFPRLERDEAVREAKELESTLGIRVKVVRETYNTDSNQMDEAEVYISGHNIQPKKGGLPAGGGYSRPGATAEVGRKASGPAAKKTAAMVAAQRAKARADTAGMVKVLFRLLIVLLVAVGFALGALRLVPSVVSFLYEYGFRVTPDEYGQLLFAVFIGVLLLTGVPLGLRMIPRNANIALRRPNMNWGGSQPTQRQATDAKLKKSLDKLAAEAAWEQIPDKWADDDDDTADISPAASPDDNLPEIRPDLDDEPPPLVPQSAEPTMAATSVDALPSTPELESSQAVTDRFVGKALDIIRQQTASPDKYTLFGLNLYMAGAVQSIATVNKMDSNGQRKLLKAIIQKLGTPSDQAAAFYEKVPDYARETKYGRMILAGKSAMESWTAGDEMTPQITLQTSLKDWNKPTSEKKSSIMTVMFTDMVGSTDLTQARGDVAAQEIVRKHNAIVRTALTQFAGHEVKHTGDGIMASFASAANAVDATIQIQRQVATHNEKQPNLPLHLRIGLNSGEPIQEEDDLFGSTVQLAARVCAATLSDQTLCTQVVKDLAGSKPIPWGNAGMHSLKGFRDPFQLWEVPW
ncbi:adenylate/guanylate cyclase domain-containing protein [Paramagnetospirillum kuznetsovii]|uniref:Adenylate/guanylate cyclase domain-containing protein n=1 Tax=Paramagnetospirillum kuznetsovii TaxID=2053833 RepID=A0A364NWI7_9PROT|nr:adenylate/guanylate cyclase domain-containing protein [Paramagnetospirillum kuznetsovii]RAU21454.1 adenylate/guanylate cyclase domain-containing protein [Paramagnetospirillum kuznetsovii]